MSRKIPNIYPESATPGLGYHIPAADGRVWLPGENASLVSYMSRRDYASKCRLKSMPQL